jgi:integrase
VEAAAMRNPNGYGGVSKLPENRRRPFSTRITTGWQGKQCYKTPRRGHEHACRVQQAPYDLDNRITFSEVCDQWSASKFNSISASSINGYKASYACCTALYDMVFAEIKLSHLHGVIDSSGKNCPTLKKLKSLLNQLYSYALKNEICEKDYSEFVDIAHCKDKRAKEKHTRFSHHEIEALWKNADRAPYVGVISIMIYTGVRCSELLDLKKKDVHLAERYFDAVSSKTDSGVRKVPIAHKIAGFAEPWLATPRDYLITGRNRRHLSFNMFYGYYWRSLMKALSLAHFLHDTRHTIISMPAELNVTPTIINRIVGHAGAMPLAERVYTHFKIQPLIGAIGLI